MLKNLVSVLFGLVLKYIIPFLYKVRPRIWLSTIFGGFKKEVVKANLELNRVKSLVIKCTIKQQATEVSLSIEAILLGAGAKYKYE